MVPQWRIQDFPEEGAPTYDFAKFSQKLHEIERISTPGGGHVSLVPALRFATVPNNTSFEQLYIALCFYRPQTKFWARYCFYTCLSFCPRGEGIGGVCPIACWGTHPPGRPPSLGRHPPIPRQTPPDTTEYSQQAGGTHPT